MHAPGGARRLMAAALIALHMAGGASAQDADATSDNAAGEGRLGVLDDLLGGSGLGGEVGTIPLPGIGGDLGDLPEAEPDAETESPPEDEPVPERDALPTRTDLPDRAAAPGEPERVETPQEPETGPVAGMDEDRETSGEAAEGPEPQATEPDAAEADVAAEGGTEEESGDGREADAAEAPQGTEAATIVPRTVMPDGEARPDDGPTLARGEQAPMPTARSFRMGFTPLPYDLTPEAFAETYDRIADHGDIVSHLLDEGVPWTAAANGTTFHPNVEADIQRRITGTRGDSAVFLSVTPLGQDRVSLAGEWAESGGMPLPESLQGLTLDHPDVVSAFVGYALRIIDRFDPDYFAYALEVTDLADESPEQREAFVTFAGEVYRAVKRVHPDLPVFPTWSLGNRAAFTDDLRDFVEALGPYSDFLAVSTYPYVWDGVGGEADRLPADWFAKMAEVLPDKPFAVAQTGFLSGTYRNLPNLVWISAGPEDQALYVDSLLHEAERLGAEFVIWYVPVDYDRLWSRLEAIGMSEWFAQWMRTGLWSSDFQPRPALEVWSEWLALPTWE